jgi:hypothetical protein
MDTALKNLQSFNKEVFSPLLEAQIVLPKLNPELEKPPHSQLEFSKELTANHQIYKH